MTLHILLKLALMLMTCQGGLAFHRLPSRYPFRGQSLRVAHPDAKLDNERTVTTVQVNIDVNDQSNGKEFIYRKYPFHDAELPILQDCNNYYSGQYGNTIWHQNSDQVFVYIPIGDDTSTNDIGVKFQVNRVDVYVAEKVIWSFNTMDRVIPDGCFWVLETDQSNGKRYIQLDLEKRYRMINWKSLFELSFEEREKMASVQQSDLLSKFYAANKGLAGLSGAPIESMEEMTRNDEFMEAIKGPSRESTIARGTDNDGNIVELNLGETDYTFPFESVEEVLQASDESQANKEVEREESNNEISK